MNALDDIFSAVLSASWHVSWLIVVVLLARPVARRFIPAQLLFATWIIVALGLLIPFGVPVRWSPFNLAKPISPLAPDKTITMPVSMPVSDAPSSLPMEKVEAAPLLTPPASTLTTREILMLLWLTGVMGLVGARLWRSASFRRRLKQASAVEDPRLHEMIGEQSRRLGLKSQPAVVISNAVSNPALFGLFRPRLIFPEGFAEKLDAAELRLVILHELGHWRRRDLLAQAAIQGAQILHWFNPLVWLARRLARLDCELACDEFVPHRTPPADLPTYGATLLKVLGVSHQPYRAPAVLGMLENKQDLKRRIRMISEYQDRSLIRTLAGVALLGSLAVACATREAWAQSPVETIVAPPSPSVGAAVPWSTDDTFDRAAAKALLVSPARGAIPVSGATHLAVVIDASGSMRDPSTDRLWSAVVSKLDEVLKSAPQLQFFQIYDAAGRTMLEAPEFPTPWVPSRPELVTAAEQAVRNYTKDNTSDPVTGIFQALRAIKYDGESIARASIWVLGDEFSSRNSAAELLQRLDEVNSADSPRTPINVVAFPTWAGMAEPANTHLKYASLMSELARRSGGTFLAAPASVMKNAAIAVSPPKAGVGSLAPARFLSPEEEQKQRQAQDRLAQERAYQQERARTLYQQAMAKTNRDTELHALDPLSQFTALMAAAEQSAAKGDFPEAGRLFNQAMALKPSDLSLSEKNRQLQATLQAQNVPVEITVNSDGLTFVSIANFRMLGQLETTTLSLPPGNYEIVGRRQGYREVRLPVQVRGGAPSTNLSVICTEPIAGPAVKKLVTTTTSPDVIIAELRQEGFNVAAPRLSLRSSLFAPDVTIQVSEQDTAYWNQEEIRLEEIAARLERYKTEVAEPRILITGGEESRFGNAIRVREMARKAGIQQVAFETRTDPRLQTDWQAFQDRVKARLQENKTIQELMAPQIPGIQRDSRDEKEYHERLEALYKSTIQGLIDSIRIAKESRAEGKGTITIDKEGVVSFQGTVVTDAQLLAVLKALHDGETDLPLLIKADETTPLQRITFVLDACRKAGLKKFSLESQ